MSYALQSLFDLNTVADASQRPKMLSSMPVITLEV